MSGRTWAYIGALLGGAVSVAANVAHSYVPPAGGPSRWAPHTGAVVGAVFWPVALFVAIEILARVAWPAGYRWVALRFLGLMPVALVAAVVSYRHLSGLLTWYHEDWLTAAVGPLAVDGLMVMATGALIATGRPVTASTPQDGDEADEDEPATDPWWYAEPVAELPRRVANDTPDEASSDGSPKLARSAEVIARIRRRCPQLKQEEVARRARVSLSTVKRQWPVTAPPAEVSPINGHRVPDLVSAKEEE